MKTNRQTKPKAKGSTPEKIESQKQRNARTIGRIRKMIKDQKMHPVDFSHCAGFHNDTTTGQSVFE